MRGHGRQARTYRRGAQECAQLEGVSCGRCSVVGTADGTGGRVAVGAAGGSGQDV